jgi:hypothetical protein
MNLLSLIVSVLAAVVTIVGGMVCAVREFRKGVRIEFRVRWRGYLNGGVRFGGYVVRVANISNANVCVRQIAFDLGGKGIVQIFAQHPDNRTPAQVLVPGQFCDFLIPYPALLAAVEHQPRKVYVETSAGRKFHAKVPQRLVEGWWLQPV